MHNKPLVLVLNCGSSSLKGAVMDIQTSQSLLSWVAERLGTSEAFITFKAEGDKHRVALAGEHNHTVAVQALLEELEERRLHNRIGAIGHRVVHGGERFTESTLVDEHVLADIEACVVLAPLHNPAHLLGIRAAQEVFPNLPQAVVFDTAFHQTMPDYAYRYAIPTELYKRYGVRRYGAHGTSYRFVAAETARLLDQPIEKLNLVIAHLGNGASICSVAGGRSVDTSMGLTPLEGLVMGTRSGDIDPSIFSFLAENVGMSIPEITDMLNKKSGLLGLSGLSNDCRTLEQSAAGGHEGANLALEVFCYRLAKYIAAMAVPLGRLDAVVFSGGIGENSATVRNRVVEKLGILGLDIDHDANLEACFRHGGVISSPASRAPVLVVPTNEELMIAQDTARLAQLI